MKLMIVAYSVPPECTAAASVTAALFKGWKYSESFLVKGNPCSMGRNIDYQFAMQMPQYKCDIPVMFRKRSFKIGLPAYLESAFLFLVVVKMLFVAKREKPDAIFAIITNHIFGIAAYIVSRCLHLPIFPYYIDEWASSRRYWFQRLAAKYYEKKLMEHSTSCLFMTDDLAELYRMRYKKLDPAKYKTLNLPIDIQWSPFTNDMIIDRSKEVVICYTGSIYDVQVHSIKTLIQAIPFLHGLQVRIIILTPADSSYLRRMGIYGNNVVIYKASRSEALEAQRKADILFLPMMSVDSTRVVASYSMPSKALEYASMSRPILVHASKDSYIGRYTIQSGFGLLVSENNPIAIAKGVEEIVMNQSLQVKLADNTKNVWIKHHHTKVSGELWSVIQAYCKTLIVSD